MRPGVMVLLIGCRSGHLEVSPAEGSARGGETITFTGSRLPDDPVVFFGGSEATVLSSDRDVLTVALPPGVSGTVAISVSGERDDLAAAFTYLPLELSFVEAAPHYLPEQEESILAAVAGDGDGDGLDEVVLLLASGRLAVWEGTGLGAMVEGAAPEVSAVAGMTWIDLDGTEVLFTCHSTGTSARLPDLGLTAPPDAAVCTGAKAADLDGDGAAEVIELRADGARVWRISDGALTRWSDTVEDDETCGDLSGAGVCEVLNGVAEMSVPSGGTTWLTLPVPDLGPRHDGISVTLRGGPARLTATGTSGASASWLLEGAGEDWQTQESPPLSQWDGAPLGRSITSLSITISGSETELDLDTVVLRLSDGGEALIADFATHPLDIVAPGARDVVAVVGGAVIGTDSGAVLLDIDAEGIREAPASRLPGADCAVGGLGTPDIDGDGVAELFIACADGQDQLYRTDGDGHWFDDTAGALPVDAAVGRAVVAVDLDLDGLHEVIVANPGGVDRLYRADYGVLRDYTTRLSLDPAQDIAVIATDVEGDGDSDLLLIGGTGEPSRLFILAQ